MASNTEIAKQVINAIGGASNVRSVAHCATRLRVMVKDETVIDKNTVENIEKVQGAFFNSGQYQIIFGTGTVNKIYDEVVLKVCQLRQPLIKRQKQLNKGMLSNELFVLSVMFLFHCCQPLLLLVYLWGFAVRLIMIQF